MHDRSGRRFAQSNKESLLAAVAHFSRASFCLEGLSSARIGNDQNPILFE